MDTANLNGSVTNINNIRFDETWKGSAAENQVNQLNNFMQDFNKCIQDITAFNVILLLRDQYIKICDRIKELDALINGCDADHDDPDCSCSCGTYAAEIAKLEQERMALRNKIIGLLGQFTGITPEVGDPVDLTTFDNPEAANMEDVPQLSPHNPFNSDLPITNPDYDGLLLTPEQGRKFNGPQAVETHYDLNMDYCVERMATEYGIPIEAWIDEETGLKMCRKVGEDKEYVMVAAYAHSVWYGNDTKPDAVYSMGDEVLTSWGEGLVVDYCEEAEDWYNAGKETRFDIATAWTPDPDVCDHPSYYAQGSAYANAVNEEYKKNHPEEEE